MLHLERKRAELVQSKESFTDEGLMSIVPCNKRPFDPSFGGKEVGKRG